MVCELPSEYALPMSPNLLTAPSLSNRMEEDVSESAVLQQVPFKVLKTLSVQYNPDIPTIRLHCKMGRYQGWAYYGPRAASGPPLCYIRPVSASRS